MRKITLLVASLFVAAIGFAQEDVIDRIPDNNTGLIATLGDDGTGVYCGDFFVLDEATTLGEVTFYGLASTPGMGVFVEGFNLYIYENVGGKPAGNPELSGTGVLELGEMDLSDFTMIEDGELVDFIVDVTQANGSEVTLPAGEYWMVGFPNVIGGPAEAGRWNWFGSLSSAPEELPKLIDPSDLFGAGATDWMDIEILIAEPFPSFAWKLTGEAGVVGIDDNFAESVSVFPNPTTDVYNISLPAGAEVTASSLVDVMGKTTGVTYNNGQMDVSALAQGVYFMTIETTQGSFTQKVVKQ